MIAAVGDLSRAAVRKEQMIGPTINLLSNASMRFFGFIDIRFSAANRINRSV
jgi:hypothetical protein